MRTKRARRWESRVIPPLHIGRFSGLAGLLPYVVRKAITALYAAQKDVSQ
jgi:hypothetical protein